tara:strand:+ start:514 stop:921 length:408 start_codon:yes stop_codon:yes gene_type:complete
MNKKGISPLIATILLVGLTVVLAVGVLNWTRSTTEGLQENVDLSQPVEVSFDAEFRGTENCEQSDDTYCYELLITNNENFDVNYLITTITSQGIEIEDIDDYSLGSYESKLFTVYYDQSLGNENVEAKVDVASLN